MAIVKTVILGRDNPFDLTFSQEVGGVVSPMDFSAVYSMLLQLQGSALAEAEYTALGVGSVVDTSPGSGVVRFRLGGIVGLTAGTYPLRLASKSSAGDTAPTQLAHDTFQDVVLVDVVAASGALVVEDGTGLTNASTYISLAAADAYHAARRNADWSAAAVVEREAALVRATDYIDTRWRDRFLGRRLSATQALQWPRTGVYDEFGSEVVFPPQIGRACAEYALRGLSASLAPDPVLSQNGQITRKLERVEGAVTEETEYAVGISAPTIRPYPLADRMLSGFVIASGELLRA